MAINSIAFVLFVAIVCLSYFVVPKKVKWVVLLIASYIFYWATSTTLIVFLLITTLSIYLAALRMKKIDEATKQKCVDLEKEKKKVIKEQAKKKKKWIIALALLLNFGILIVLKYGNFIGGSINSLFTMLHLSMEIPLAQFILPLGISFYTLQATSYLIDVYRGKYPADKNLGRVALFVAFFPQIVEGPIGRYDRLAQEVYQAHTFDYTRMKFGIQLMVWGFFKKIVIADRAALYVNQVFGNYGEYAGIVVVVAILLYTLQIYTEFSGCIDIVRGIAQIVGVPLDENFKRPFFSRSVQEFWRRWNITLGTWLKEYVFYSVSFSKASMKLTNFAQKFLKGHIGKLVPAAFALFFVWFCNGLWHGASWKYIVYGLYYYMIMLLGMLFAPVGKKLIEVLKINIHTFSYKLFEMLRTTGFVLLGMLIFRAPDLTVASNMLQSIFKVKGIRNVI